MGRPTSGLDEYVEWQQRLERYQVSDLDLQVFCLQEGVSRSTFYRWKDRLKEGIPESVKSPATSSDSTQLSESVFVPLSLPVSSVEFELPNGGVVRVPADVGQSVLVALVRVAGSLRPWRPPQS